MSKSLMPPLPNPAASVGQKQVVFEEVVLWLVANYGLLAVGEQRGAGRVVPLRTRIATATALTAFRTKLLPYRIADSTGAKISPLDLWLTLPDRIEVAGFRTAPDKPWPTFVEGDATYVNPICGRSCPKTATRALDTSFSRCSCQTNANGHGSSSGSGTSCIIQRYQDRRSS